jgi:hypothetical protein
VTIGPRSLRLQVQEQALRRGIKRIPDLSGLIGIGKRVGFEEERLDELRVLLTREGVIREPAPVGAG